jgi:hypothetical protein
MKTKRWNRSPGQHDAHQTGEEQQDERMQRLPADRVAVRTRSRRGRPTMSRPTSAIVDRQERAQRVEDVLDTDRRRPAAELVAERPSVTTRSSPVARRRATPASRPPRRCVQPAGLHSATSSATTAPTSSGSSGRMGSRRGRHARALRFLVELAGDLHLAERAEAAVQPHDEGERDPGDADADDDRREDEQVGERVDVQRGVAPAASMIGSGAAVWTLPSMKNR